jgi:hypothetical protein
MPSYPNITPNLGKINFDDIKKSMIDYMKSQDTLKDFNFDGSVMQTLINVLAYNTYYYAFYSNMVANESFLDSAQRIDSLISLTKPLGYFVPLRTSARATVNVSGLTSDIPEYAKFRGLDTDGVVYDFYTLKSYANEDSQAMNVEIVEGRLTSGLDVTNLINTQKQRFFINDANIDASTIKVRVQKNGAINPDNVKEPWTLVDNFGSYSVADQNVFYLERANNGVYVLFGKINSLGNSVDTTNDRIFLDYLSSSGKAANDIVAFSLIDNLGTNINIGLVKKAHGGLDEPDLDLVRFAAPKSFGAQNRAVTKDDIKALIAPFFESPSDFNVFGGEELFPQRFGRVFFTADLNPNNSDDQLVIQNIYNILSDKCVVTVLPEFTNPKSLAIQNQVAFTLNTNRLAQTNNQTSNELIRNGIKSILNTNYDTAGSYNYTFNAADAISEIIATYPDVVIEPSDFRIYYTETFTTSGKITINLENELDIPYFIDYELTSEFQNKFGQVVKLAAYLLPSQNKYEFFNLKTLRKQQDGTFTSSTQVLGRINVKKGIIEIYSDRLAGSQVTVAIDFKNSYFATKTNNKVVFTTNTVEFK